MNKKERERQESIKLLRKMLKPGKTVYTVLRHVSRSGMRRMIDLYVIKRGQDPICITSHVARILKWGFSESYEALIVEGSGMDMGFATVYDLSRNLYPKGFIPAKAGHKYGRNGTPVDQLDTDGGYALSHRWM